MIRVNLDDPHLTEHLECLNELREFGYSDEEIQKLYDEQVEKDKRSDNNAE